MAYKVFFAFQMDTEDKFGKGFIQSAIEIAIQKFKSEDTEITLDFGFRGTPGTPLLIDEMLKKSTESDMVIVDLTFTSSKVWSKSKKMKFFGKELRLLDIKNDKKSPNPNVLLETGYAWAKKGTYRTLAVMNEAFGSPEELPVDLKGFRWGITYNLNETNNTERRAIRKQLGKDFHEAIKAAINSEAHYQQEKWNPIKLHKNWGHRDFNTIYRPTLRAKEIIRQLRIDLENTERPQRLVGPKNSGKTRLAYELYKEIDQTLPKHDNLEKILYYDLDGGDYRFIESKLLDLKELNQRKILILDNCPIKIHSKVFNELFYDSEISLLTIGNTEDGEGASQFIDIDFANEVIEKISNETGDSKNTNFILEKANGNLRNAIAMIGKIPEGDIGLSSDYEVKWQQILGEELYSTEVLQILEELSLFTHIGFYDRYQYQSEIIIKNTGVDSKESLEKTLDQLTERGIVKITGDFIILEVFVEELAFKRLERLAKENLNEYFKLITNCRLSKQFSNRLVELNKLKGTHSLIEVLSQEGGLLTQYDFINSDQGARILMSLAEIEPVKVLQIIETAIGSKNYDELKEVEDGRRYIVWSLERLVYREETFEGAANLLFKLSVAENENIGNNATSQFCQLFQLFLPATTASLAVRLDLLNKLITDATAPETKVIVSALDRALMVRGFTRMGGADKQAGETFVDYQPKTDDEILNYWKTVIEMLESLGEYDILVNKFNAQIHEGNGSAILNAIERKLEKDGTIDKDLRQQFEYLINDKREVPPGIIDKIKELLEKYSENTVREKLEYKVALAPYSAYKTKEGKMVNRSEEKAEELAKELITSGTNDWLNDIDVLLTNEQRLTFGFGQNIAKLKQDYQVLVDIAIYKLSQVVFEEQNNSFVEGYLSGVDNQEFKRKVIDLYLAKDETAYHAIRMTRFLEVELSDLEKLYDLISTNPRYVVALQYLKLNNLSNKDFISFINWLKEIEPFGWWTSIDICQFNLEKKEELSAPILELIRNLLMKTDILKGDGSHTPFSMLQYVDLFKKYEKDNLDDELAQFLANEIITVSKEISINHEHHFKDILDILFEKKWQKTWAVIGSNILKSDYYGWYNLKGLLKKYKAFDQDNLLSWMDQHPDEAPQKVISFIELIVKDGDNDKWAPIVLEMFNRYSSNESFLSVLSSDLHSYFWSGSLVPLLESRKRLVEQLLTHEKNEIQNFAKTNVAYFEDSIKRERRNDQNYGLDF